MNHQRKGMASVELLMLVAVSAIILMGLKQYWVTNFGPQTVQLVQVVLGQEESSGDLDTDFQINRPSVSGGDRRSPVSLSTFASGAPGIYVLGRDIAGLGKIKKGRGLAVHQFLVLIPESKDFRGTIDLGNGVKGIVLGAHNIDGRLKMRFGEPGDVASTAEYVNPQENIKWWLMDFDTKVAKVDIGSRNVDDSIRDFLSAARRYHASENANNIRYPSPLGQLGIGKNTLNSNSFAQSIVEHVIGPGAVKETFGGSNALYQNRIPESYFSIKEQIDE